MRLPANHQAAHQQGSRAESRSDSQTVVLKASETSTNTLENDYIREICGSRYIVDNSDQMRGPSRHTTCSEVASVNKLLL